MILSEIRQSNSANRVTLYFEDGSRLQIRKQTAAEFDLYTGMELPDGMLSRLKTAAEADAAKLRAVRIAASTNISAGKLTRRLRQKGESPENAAQAVSWLEGLNLLDDRRTGENVVRSAVSKGYGKMRIRQILREKEIPEEFWDDLLCDLPPMDETVDRLLQQKLRNKELNRKNVQRAAEALVRYGHSWSDIKAGLGRCCMDAEMDLEEPECL